MNRFYIEKDDSENVPLLSTLQNAARSARTHVAKQLLSTGLYAGQEGVMELLSTAESRTLGEIATALGVKPPTVTRTVTRLQEQGFVERHESPVDARQVQVRLTESGKNVIDNMHAAVAQAEEQAFGSLKKKERKQLAKILTKIEDNLDPEKKPPARKKKKKQSANTP
ncbi:MarR family winged helix-turn-helix transcriptional regulator [Oricola sp.]|uniref:MarR family winged helix-turn-helix transcriptional regulator n=1 Tax=Oricola sp. TaxID=1979950 RepID=UPI003BA93E6E